MSDYETRILRERRDQVINHAAARAAVRPVLDADRHPSLRDPPVHQLRLLRRLEFMHPQFASTMQWVVR